MCLSGIRDKRQAGDPQVCCKEDSIQNNDNHDETPNQPMTNRATSARCGRHNICGSADNSGSDSCLNNGEENASGDIGTKFGEWPHMCAIMKNRIIGNITKIEYWAGASLITPGILLTAAHWVK